MTDRPLVSIVTPTLNQGQFIEATIRSIKAQTYDRFEHIVIDGGSTDGTLDILRRHEGTYPMRWQSEPDRGMYDAVNKGMRQATGDILCYLNSDDLYFPWTLETVVDAFRRWPEADFVFGDAFGVAADGRGDLRFQPAHRRRFLLYASSFVQPAVFWRRSVAAETGDFDASMRLAGDLDYWLRMGPDRRFVRIDEVLAVERDHALTQRSRQWTTLMAESSRARDAAGAAGPPARTVLRTTERFRAWGSRRSLSLRFARELGRRDHAEGWARFLETGSVRVDPFRYTVGQLPWVGRRLGAGAVEAATPLSPTAGRRGRTLGRQRADWEDLATFDPLWAILSDPAKRHGGWDMADFLASGVAEIDAVMAKAGDLGFPEHRRLALDFGCGVGRLTRALGHWFEKCVGVDVAAPMVEQARTLNADQPNVSFRLNDAPDLRSFGDGTVDLVYTNIVLQHMLSRGLIEGYVREFVRVVAPGGLVVFQLPSAIPLRYQLQPRRHAYRALRAIGVSPGVLQDRLSLSPISMRAIPQAEVAALLERAGASLLATDVAEITDFGITSVTYWATRE